MIIGKIILIKSKAARDGTAEALSYGHADEPSPDLLLRRERATLFATGTDAKAALQRSLEISAKNGETWPAKFRFKIVTVERNDD